MAKVKGYDLDTSAHAVFSLYYNIIFVTKYRRKAMHSETIRERLKQIMYDLAPGLKIQIVSQEPADDHIHLLIRGTPSTDLVQVTNTLKGVWMYECVTYLKGFPDKIVFQSALYHNRDGAVFEVQQFLRNNIEYINEWVN